MPSVSMASEGQKMHYQKNLPNLKEFSRDLRKNDTRAESVVWDLVRNRNLCGVKFRRQQPIGRYILDFYSDELRLAVEIDGETHNNQTVFEKDQLKEEYLIGIGIKVVRLNDEEVLGKKLNVYEFLLDLVKSLK